MGKLTIEAVDPMDLTGRDFEGVAEVMQDMWASDAGMGELAHCNDCGKMVSKEHAFGHLSKDLTEKTVAHIMSVLGMEEVPCTVCGGETRLIYGSDSIDKIRERVLGSVDAFMILCRDEDRIVGFEEAYIGSVERMFKLDFVDHYGGVGLPEIERRVERMLGYFPDELLLTSSLGLLEPYRNFQNLYGIMSGFARALPEAYLGMPGLAELDRGGVTHRMSIGLGHGTSLGIEDVPELRAKMTCVGEKFNGDLVVYPDSVRMYKDKFTVGHRQFLSSLREKPEARNRRITTEAPMMASV